jgi:hypothetical protein
LYTSNFDFFVDNASLHLTLQPGGVQVLSPGGDAVDLANTTVPSTFGAPLSITANDASITNTSNGGGDNNTGLRIQSAGSATITASGPIAVNGNASDDAILAIIEGNNPANAPADVRVTYGTPQAPGQGLSSSGSESSGIQADNRGNGNASIEASGNITGLVVDEGNAQAHIWIPCRDLKLPERLDKAHPVDNK